LPSSGIELHRKAADVALGIGRPPLARDGREAPEALSLFADLAEYLGLGIASDVTADRQGAVGAGTFGVHHVLRDPFAIEMGVLFEELPVLHQERATRAGDQAILIVTDRDAGGGRQGGFTAHVVLLRGCEPIRLGIFDGGSG
jgi:hypothetical protein